MQHQNRSKPPVTAEPSFEEIPEELRNLKQWVMWRYVWKERDGCRLVNGVHQWNPEPNVTTTHHRLLMLPKP